jgi:hypothetical protein
VRSLPAASLVSLCAAKKIGEKDWVLNKRAWKATPAETRRGPWEGGETKDEERGFTSTARWRVGPGPAWSDAVNNAETRMVETVGLFGSGSGAADGDRPSDPSVDGG